MTTGAKPAPVDCPFCDYCGDKWEHPCKVSRFERRCTRTAELGVTVLASCNPGAIWSCTRPLEQFQCAGDEKDPTAGCHYSWVGVPWKTVPENAWCPNCGNYSPWDADIADVIEYSGEPCQQKT